MFNIKTLRTLRITTFLLIIGLALTVAFTAASSPNKPNSTYSYQKSYHDGQWYAVFITNNGSGIAVIPINK